MYGLPSDFECGVLTKRYLTMVRFGRSSLHLDLCRIEGMGKDDFVEIAILGSYAYAVAGKAFEGNASNALSGMHLVELLNCDVTEVRIVGRGDLVIGFGIGNHIHICEDDSGFESYMIYIPEQKEIVV